MQCCGLGCHSLTWTALVWIKLGQTTPLISRPIYAKRVFHACHVSCQAWATQTFDKLGPIFVKYFYNLCLHSVFATTTFNNVPMFTICMCKICCKQCCEYSHHHLGCNMTVWISLIADIYQCIDPNIKSILRFYIFLFTTFNSILKISSMHN